MSPRLSTIALRRAPARSIGHASVEYLIALSLVGLVLAIDRFSAFEFLVRAMGEMYARYAFALSLP